MSSDLLLKIIFRADGAGDVAQAVHEITERLGKTEKEAKQADRALQGTEEALQDTGAAAQKTEQQLDGMAKAADQAAEGLNKTDAASKGAARSVEGLGGVAETVAGHLGGLATGMASAIAGALGFSAFKEATSDLIQYHNELKNAKYQLGVSTEALQVWGLGAEKAGLSSEKMRDIFKDVSDKLGELAATDGGEAVDVIKKLGLNIKELDKMSPDKALLKIGHALNTVKGITQNQKTFLLEALADESSALQPLLANNAALLREIGETAERRGLLITAEEKTILDQASNALSEMKSAGAGVKQEVGLLGAELLSAFGPHLTDALDWVNESLRTLRTSSDGVSGFISNLFGKDQVSSFGSEVLQGAIGTLQTLGDVAAWVVGVFDRFDVIDKASQYFELATTAISTFLDPLQSLSGYTADFIGAMGIIGGILGTGAVAFGVLASAVTATIGVISTLGAALLANPIGLTIAAIGAAAYVIYDNWGSISSWWNGLWSDMQTTTDSFLSWWDSTTFSEKVLDIATAQIEEAQNLVSSFANWWDGSTLKAWGLEIEAASLSNAKQAAQVFNDWWQSWDLREVVADITADTLIWAWDKAQAFGDWWSTWSLDTKAGAADMTLLEQGWEIAQRFVSWWQNLSLKALIPEIKLPSLSEIGKSANGAWQKMRSAGEDIVNGLAEGMSRADSHIKASRQAAQSVEDTVRSTLDTHSPSRVMALVGLDVSTGLASGIIAGSGEIQAASKEAAKQSEDSFKQVVQGLEQQYLKLADGEEPARRYALTMRGIVGAKQDAIIAAEAHIKKLEEEKKQTEEAAKAQEKIHDALKKAAEALSIVRVEQAQGKEAARTHALELEGYTTAQATAQTADESRTEAIKEQIQQQEKAKEGLKEAAEALSLARIEQEQGKEVARQHALELEGYTATQAAAQAADESRTAAIKEQIQQQEKIRDALKDAANALAIARIEQEQGKEAARAHALELEGYTTAQATAQTADEKRTEALKEQTQQQTKAKDEVKKLREELKVKTVALTQSAAAADLLKYKTEGYGVALAQTRVELEKQIAALDRQGAIANAVSDGLTEAMLEAVKTGRFEFESLADSLEDTFNNMVLKPVIQAVMQPVSGLLTNAISGAGNGLANLLGLGNLFGSTGAAGAAGSGLLGTLSTSITGAVTSFLGGGGLASSIGGVVGALGPVGLAVGAAMLFGKLFGGKQSIKAAFGNSADDKWEGGGWYGTSRSAQALQRTTAFGTFGLVDGSRSVGRDSKEQITQMQTLLDGMAALDNAFAALIPNTKQGQAAIDAVRAAMDGFTGNALDGVGLMTQRAMTMFEAMPEGVKQALQGIDGGLFKDGMKGVAERIQYVGTVAQQVLPQLSALGLKISQSWDLALRDAALLTDALGGTDAALKQLAFYVENFADPAELAAAALKQSKDALDAWNAKLGLSGVAAIDSKDEFEQYIKSLDLTTAAGRDAAASAFQYMQSILVVDKAQKEATETLDAMVKISDQLGIQFDALHPGALGAAEALAQLVGGMDALKEAAAKYYEAAYSDAERNAKEREAAQAKLDAFNRSMKTHISNILDLRAYVDALDPMTEKGRAAIAQAMGMVDALVILGGTAEEIAAKTTQLKDSIADLIGKLYSSSTSTTDTSVDDSASALDAARSALDGLKDSYDAEKERIDALNQANEKRYQEELARYEGLKDAAQGLRELISGLTDPIDDKLTALAKAQRTYNSLLQAAQTGDVEAASKLGGSAQELRDALMNAYGGDQRSIDAIHLLEKQLADAANALDLQAGSAPTKPTKEQGNLTELERLIASQQQLVDSLSKSAAGDKATAATDRQALALELAKKIGELGLAQDRSVFALLKENGINLQALAADFGINIGKLDTSMLGSLDKLGDALNVDIVSLTKRLGGNIDVLGDLIAKKLEALPGVPDNIKKGLEPYLKAIEKANDPTTLKLAIAALQGRIDQLPPAIKAKLNAELQSIIGNTSATTANIGSLITKNKEAIEALATSFGIDIGKLNQSQLGKLDQLADALHIDTVSLTTALGGNIDRLGNLISTKLGSMDGLPADIEKGLAPYLKAIEKANDPTTLKLAIAALEGHIDQLPPDIKAKLNAELQSIIGNTSATTANIGNLIAKNKEAIEALAKSFGIDIGNLNQAQLGKLDKLADALHIDTVSLAAALGGNIDKMGDLIAGKLGSLPGIPENIKAGLAPYLKAIELANDPTTLKTELERLQTYVNSLPPDIKAKLNEQLGGILGNTGNTDQNTKATKTETEALRSVKDSVLNTRDHVGDLKDFTRLQLMNNGVALVLQNARALNQNAANVGKSAINSFRVGTDALGQDGLIYAHAGEAVYTPEQTDSMRKNSIAALQVLPLIAAAALKPTLQQEVIVVNTTPAMQTAQGYFKNDSSPAYMDLKPVLSELQKTREANERQAYEVIRTAKATLRLLEDWDQYIAVEVAA